MLGPKYSDEELTLNDDPYATEYEDEEFDGPWNRDEDEYPDTNIPDRDF